MIGNSVFVDVPYTTWASIGGDTVSSVGNSDYFIAEYSPLGTVQWIRNVTGISNNESKMEVMNGRIYLNGKFQDVIHFENDSLAASGTYGFYIAEYDTSGNFIKAKETGWCNVNPNSFLTGPVIDTKGNIYFAGGFKDTLHIGDTALISCGVKDGFIAKFDTMINLRWVIQMCDDNDCEPLCIKLDDRNYLYVAGEAGHATQVLDTVLNTDLRDAFLLKIWHEDVLPLNVARELNKSKKEQLKLFPDPANKILYIVVNDEIKSGIAEIYSLQGNMLKIHCFWSSHFSVDVSDLPAGIYFLRIGTGSSSLSEKFGIVR